MCRNGKSKHRLLLDAPQLSAFSELRASQQARAASLVLSGLAQSEAAVTKLLGLQLRHAGVARGNGNVLLWAAVAANNLLVQSQGS